VLSHHAIEAIVSRVTYKPGWELVVRDLPVQGTYLSVYADLENSYAPGTTVPLRIHSPIPPMADADALLTWLAWRLRMIEVHELLEWLKIDGKPWIDPHEALD
jgi:hypothetical protein